MFYPDFSYARLITGAKTLKAGGEVSKFEDFNLFIIMFACGAIGFVLFLLVIVIP